MELFQYRSMFENSFDLSRQHEQSIPKIMSKAKTKSKKRRKDSKKISDL